MIRLLMFLFGKQYEECKSCETLRLQLKIANEDRERLTQTLIDILKPKVVEAAPIVLENMAGQSSLFSRRRAALEERDRLEAQVATSSTYIKKPDDQLRKVAPISGLNPAQQDQSIEKLETELGVQEQGVK